MFISKNVIDIETFKMSLESKLLNRGNTNAKPNGRAWMFRIMIVYRYYGLGDMQAECPIYCKLSIKKFVELESGFKVADEQNLRGSW